MDTTSCTNPVKENSTDVPGLLIGDFLFHSQQGNLDKSQTHFIFGAGITGESLEKVATGMQKTYGPSLNGRMLTKLMSARNDRGRILFYSELPPFNSKNKRTRRKNDHSNISNQSSAGYDSNRSGGGFNFQGLGSCFYERIGALLLDRGGTVDYIRTAWNVARGVFQKHSTRRPCRHTFACMASSNENRSMHKKHTADDVVSVQSPEDDYFVTENLPLEVAIRLLTGIRHRYSLVINKSDRMKQNRAEKELQTPVFSVKGVQLRIDTTKGPVTLIPMFFSKNEVQRTFALVRNFVRHLWLTNRARRRSEICNNFVSEISSVTGMDRILSDQRPIARGSVEDPEDDEGLGDGDPPEMKEFIEELEDTGQEFIAKPAPSLLGLPLMILFGCVTVSTAIWRDCASFFDLMLLKSPLESIVLGIPKKVPYQSMPLESCVEQCFAYNSRKQFLNQAQESSDDASLTSSNRNDEESPRTVPWLETMQLVVAGILQVAKMNQHRLRQVMRIYSSINNMTAAPNLRKLRKESVTCIMGSIFNVQQGRYARTPGSNHVPSDPVSLGTMDLRFCFNLHQTFDEKDDDKNVSLSQPFDPSTALGLCLIGNLGLQALTTHVPSIGFTDVSSLKGGISCQCLES